MKIFTLTKILLKSADVFQTKQSNKLIRTGILLAICISVGSILYPIIYTIMKTYDVLAQFFAQSMLLDIVVLLSCSITFILGIFYVVSIFYLSDDTKYLLPLPLKPFEILGAKFIAITLYEYVTQALLIVPILLVYGIKGGLGFAYYMYAILAFLILPVIPLVLASIIAMIIMKTSDIFKNKEKLKLFGAIASIFIIVPLSFLMQKLSNSAARGIDQASSVIAIRNSKLMTIILELFPNAKYSILALDNFQTPKGLLYMFIALCITALAFILFLYMAQLLYLKVVTDMADIGYGKSISLDKEERKLIKHPVYKTYILKEIHILVRTPNYLINCVLTNFIWPIFLAIPIFAGSMDTGNLKMIMKLLTDLNVAGPLVAGVFALILFIASSNGIASTAISREGKGIIVNKYIPVKYSKQLFYKIVPSLAAGLVCIITVVLAIILLMRPPVYVWIYMTVVSIVAVIMSSLIGILVDVYRPKLNWNNEAEAVKQNLNVLISMIINTALAVVTCYIVFKAKLTLLVAFTSLLVIYGMVSICLYVFLRKNAYKLIDKINL